MQNDFLPGKPAPELKPTSDQNKTQSESSVPFETPDQIREHDNASDSLDPHTPAQPPRGTGHHWFNIPWPPNKIEVILSCAVLALVAFSVIGFVVLHKPQTTQTAATVVATNKPKPSPKPTTVASTLSGLEVAPEINQRPVVGVMIENSQTARPQAGLSDAGVVIEAIAEGGITRFLALFQDKQPTNIGPVRSARPYYVQWNEGFRAAYVHVGGSPAALQDIKNWNVQDINQFYNSGVFHRVSDRPSPHNLYSNVADLANLAAQKGFKSEFTGFERKSAAPAKQPTVSTINLNISSALYNAQYSYDAASNTYARAEGGAAQVDSNTGKQLAPNVVVAMVVPMTPGEKTSQGGSYSDYNPIGTGTAYIFQDGGVIIGNWTKTAITSQITFTDAKGAVVKLNPGQTWITAVTANAKVTYQ